ncbi:hypothetical protein DVH24_018384 [Malus domestica]|uniref:TIR domain-containing protein n=1 Tax=Malus domestica TaxID=3750 RepID=A0A498KL31_MALDO|nr:hypothetical protein DVH24_018384 [Malus domestica]
MAGQLVSSSSFTSNPSWKYDVFLSFRGEDTRTNFTDHLYKGLVDKGIHTFIDRQLSRGEEISPALLKAIEESRISLVIFSKSYASSRCCLDELVKILQCRESKKQIVLPVFYKVDPSHVGNQKSSFGDAFTDHESKFKDKKKVLMWRRALREVANLSGYPLLQGEYGTKKIKGIVVELPEPDVITLNAESFLRMVNLEIFINRNARFFGRIDYLPNDLRWIELGGQSNFHRRHIVVFNLPPNYHPRHLATFDVAYSGIRSLKGFKNLAKLTNMNLSGCEFLEKIPDLSGSPNLKHLVLSDCKSLVEVDDSVGFLDKLVELNLYGCSKLTRFVTRLGSRFLKTLSLRSCARLESFPEIEERMMESLTDLDIGESGIRELPSSIAYLTGLAYLFADKCENLIGTSLHHLSGLQSLSAVSFRQCPKLVTYGKNKRKFDEVSSSSTESQLLSTDLETSQDNCSTWLDLSRNNFVSLPDCISKFVNLETLYLTGCKRLREIPQLLPPNLKFLYLNDCASLEKTPKLPPMLNYLDLTNCYRLSGDEVAKLENNLLNEESLWCPGLEVIYPGNEVPKWFSYASNHPTTVEHLPEDDEIEEFVGGSEFCFEIPLNLQGETLLGLAVSVVLDAPGTNLFNSYILINRSPWFGPYFSRYKHIEAAHVLLKVLDLDENAQRRDICQVIFRFSEGARIKSCGVHLLRATKMNGLPNEHSWEEASFWEGSDIFYDAYDHQEQ